MFAQVEGLPPGSRASYVPVRGARRSRMPRAGSSSCPRSSSIRPSGWGLAPKGGASAPVAGGDESWSGGVAARPLVND